VKVADTVAVAGHEVHVCRYREARTLLRWLGQDLRGLRVLDVAGGDGYWPAQARGHGARAVALDLADAKLRRRRRRWWPPPTAPRTTPSAPSCSSVLDADDRLRPAGREVLTGDFVQGVGFVVDGTSTKACRGRAVDASSALPACPGGPGKEQVRSWHLAY
jgi:hypothetical protein